ncbi:MAG: carbon starvation protein A [Verrucomicrobia bacterium]|nr:carbon starvation protein A [Verrucomicrobiota bacterium]MCG2678900.1 carbon starvation protein A [Kiritimatiellia bacterium]MBU4248471.1 carbon starvation protein A [Verrucomicrobiota bacterium]MBU4291725.1 carbon starvation protein A [Verrucomicrobiota bacterium]MBU4428101.1 carbon starvation protein A [Verrucomicrobiota bacterium]
MNVLVPLLLGLGLLILAGRTYAFYLSRRLGVDEGNIMPSQKLRDGHDYIPTRTHVVFAHHFSVIAGAGPIVGPILALAYGWAPAWFWIVLGCILFGAVHDMTSMFVSMREDGRSIADMCRRTMGGPGYLLFAVFLIMMLTLINAIFLNLSCKALTAAYPVDLLQMDAGDHLLNTFVGPDGVVMARIGGIATTSLLIITACAPILGWLFFRKYTLTIPLYIIAEIICVASVIAGFAFPITLGETEWRYLLSAYVFIACWVPVWLILQPRDFVNVQILYGGVIVLVAGLLYYGFTGHVVHAGMFDLSRGAQLTGGTVWPFLLITIACGAISGGHAFATTGTTVKQISSESEVRRVGYNAMLLEGAMALMALLLVAAALPQAEFRNIVFPASKDGNPILAFSVAMGYMLHDMTGMRISLGAVMGILILEGFVITTFDTFVRLCRYIIEELWVFIFRGRPWAILKNPFFNTAVAVGLMLFFALNSTIMSAWKIFGAGNQLIAALTLTVVTVWLLQRGKTIWFTILPALFMVATTYATLLISLKHYLAPLGSGRLVVEGQGPLAFAALLLLVLATGVLIIAIRKFRALQSEQHRHSGARNGANSTPRVSFNP